jgi:hypothetical protein
MKLIGKICWKAGIIFMAIALVLFMYYTGALSKVINWGITKDTIWAMFTFSMLGAASLIAGFVLGVIAKIKEKK